MFAVFLGIFALVTVAAFCLLLRHLDFLPRTACRRGPCVDPQTGGGSAVRYGVRSYRNSHSDFGVRAPGNLHFPPMEAHRPPLYCKEKTQKKVNCVQVGHNPVNPVGRWIRLL